MRVATQNREVDRSGLSFESATTLNTTMREKGHASIDQSSEESSSRVSEKALLRKMDLRIVPILQIIFLLNFLDRSNISNAMTIGLQKDIKLQGNEINTALLVFYASYIVLEIPSNLLIKKLKPHVWLSVSLFFCGIIVMCHGLIHNYASLIALRILLGAAESGLFPGCVYLFRMWYSRDEMIKRFVIFFSGITLASAFGSLLAGAISKMDGVAGLAGWRWIFIIEGLFTIVFTAFAFFIIPDFPQDARWLSDEERQFILDKQKGDQLNDEISTKQAFKKVFTDPKSYLASLAVLGCFLPNYSMVYFLPTIVSQFRYSRTQTQLHSVPPFAVGLVWFIVVAFVSARINQRLVLILANNALALIAVGLLLHFRNFNTLYGITFLLALGIWGCTPLILCWCFNNLRGHAETAIGSALYVAAGNFGGIIATYGFVQKEAPYYPRGYALCALGVCLSGAGSIGYAVCTRIENRSKPAGLKLVDR